ncbi:hypothetical protein HDU97_005816 [Phlyctochytrium planicorne]|nr:hypothetical protein HDU97_005816 [Phlyctochytrium planicorne]
MSSNTSYNAILEVEPDTTDESQLEFQSYVLQSAEQNLSGKVSAPTLNRTASATDFDTIPTDPQPHGAPQTSNGPGGGGAFWTVEYYQKWFDVDSDEVGKRILAAVLPRGGFMQRIEGNPDLYALFVVQNVVAGTATSADEGSDNSTHPNRPLARTIAVGVVVVGHAGLALLFRFYFFGFISDVSK